MEKSHETKTQSRSKPGLYGHYRVVVEHRGPNRKERRAQASRLRKELRRQRREAKRAG